MITMMIATTYNNENATNHTSTAVEEGLREEPAGEENLGG